MSISPEFIERLLEHGGTLEVKPDGTVKIKVNGDSTDGARAQRNRRYYEKRKQLTESETASKPSCASEPSEPSEPSYASECEQGVLPVLPVLERLNSDVTYVTFEEPAEPEESSSREGEILILAREKAKLWKLHESTADRWLAELNGDIPQEWGKSFASWVSRQSLRSA